MENLFRIQAHVGEWGYTFQVLFKRKKSYCIFIQI